MVKLNKELKLTNLFKYSVVVSGISLLAACNTGQATSDNKQVENNENEIERIVIHGNYVQYENENAMNEDADLILVVNAEESFLDREHVTTYIPADEDLPETIEDFYTRTSVNVKQVLKAPEHLDIEENSNFSIIEPIAIVEEEGVKKELAIENYVEITEDNDYIVYLGENTYGEYSVINMNNGKFNLDAEDQIDSLSEHNHENDKEEHDVMKEEVIERFEDEINE